MKYSKLASLVTPHTLCVVALVTLALVSCQSQSPTAEQQEEVTELAEPPPPTSTATEIPTVVPSPTSEPTSTETPTAVPSPSPTSSPTPILGMYMTFADSDWDGELIPHGQQCTPQGGIDPSTPQIVVSNIPTGSDAIILEFSDRDWGPMDNGGHGKVGFTIPEGTEEALIPSVAANTFDLPEGFFLVKEHRNSFLFTPGAYMPPCSGGIGNSYYVTVKAVEMISIEDLTFNVLEEAILELGKY